MLMVIASLDVHSQQPLNTQFPPKPIEAYRIQGNTALCTPQSPTQTYGFSRHERDKKALFPYYTPPPSLLLMHIFTSCGPSHKNLQKTPSSYKVMARVIDYSKPTLPLISIIPKPLISLHP